MAMDAQSALTLAANNLMAELGAQALKRVLENAPTELSPRLLAAHESKVEFIASLWRLPAASSDALPVAFPFIAVKQEEQALPWAEKIARSQRNWADAVEACQKLATHGCQISAYNWLCVSLFYSNPGGCYPEIAGTLFGLATLLAAPASWRLLGLCNVPAAGTTISPAAKKVRERVLREVRWLCRALIAIIESLRKQRKDAESGAIPTSSQPMKTHATQLLRSLYAQGPEPLRACAESVRRLARAVGPWLGEAGSDASTDEFFRIEPLRWLASAFMSLAGCYERGEMQLPDLDDNDNGSARAKEDAEATIEETASAAAETEDASQPAPVPPAAAPLPPPRPRSAVMDALERFIPSSQPGGPKNPLPYMLRRAQLWSAPPAALTDCEGPSSDDAQKIISGLDVPELNPTEALDRAEALLFQYPFWLDLQPRIVGWLAELGANRACDAVRMMWLALLEQQPLFVAAESRLKSGVRAVSLDAQAFAREEVTRLAELPPPPQAPRTIERDAALRALQQKVRLATSERQRFLLRLEMAELCQRSRSLELAVALCSSLLEDARAFRLGDWEPALLQRVLVLFLSLSEERELTIAKEVRSNLLAQLSRIDPIEVALR